MSAPQYLGSGISVQSGDGSSLVLSSEIGISIHLNAYVVQRLLKFIEETQGVKFHVEKLENRAPLDSSSDR